MCPYRQHTHGKLVCALVCTLDTPFIVFWHFYLPGFWIYMKPWIWNYLNAKVTNSASFQLISSKQKNFKLSQDTSDSNCSLCTKIAHILLICGHSGPYWIFFQPNNSSKGQCTISVRLNRLFWSNIGHFVQFFTKYYETAYAEFTYSPKLKTNRKLAGWTALNALGNIALCIQKLEKLFDNHLINMFIFTFFPRFLFSYSYAVRLLYCIWIIYMIIFGTYFILACAKKISKMLNIEMNLLWHRPWRQRMATKSHMNV